MDKELSPAFKRVVTYAHRRDVDALVLEVVERCAVEAEDSQAGDDRHEARSVTAKRIAERIRALRTL